MAQQSIGKYRILDGIASGTQGSVYRAYDAEAGRLVALKVLHPTLTADRTYLERFRREATLAASVDHPNVVRIFDVGEADGQHFIAMEFLPENLGRVIESGALPVRRVAGIAAGIADGIGAVHDLGIVHRDLKPQNVLITPEGTPKVTDFGIARAEALGTMTAIGVLMGTPFYMSPEQADGKRADARSDVYALGCVLYQLLTGEVPFQAETPLGVLRQHIERPPRPIKSLRDDVPQELVAVVERALAKEPDERYENGAAMAQALRLAIPGIEGVAVAPTPEPKVEVVAQDPVGSLSGPPSSSGDASFIGMGTLVWVRHSRKRQLVLATAAIAVLGIVSAIAVALAGGGSDPVRSTLPGTPQVGGPVAGLLPTATPLPMAAPAPSDTAVPDAAATPELTPTSAATSAAASSPDPAPTATPSATAEATETQVLQPILDESVAPTLFREKAVWFGEGLSSITTLTLDGDSILKDTALDHYTAMKDDLETLGFRVDLGLEVPSKAELDSYGVIMLPVPDNTAIDGPLADEILELVDGGAGLLVTLNNFRASLSVNRLAQTLGIRYHQGDVIADDFLFDEGSFEVRDINLDHPVMDGVEVTIANYMAPMTILGAPGVMVTTLATAPTDAHSVVVPDGTPLIYAAAIEYGLGRAVFLADQTFKNIEGDYESLHRQLLVNIMDWLYQPTVGVVSQGAGVAAATPTATPVPPTPTPEPVPTPTHSWAQREQFTFDSLTSVDYTDSGDVSVGASAGAIYSSNNNGENWTRSIIGNCHIFGVDYLTETLALGIDRCQGDLLKTTDGGQTWRNASFDPLGDGDATAASFLDSATGWIVTNDGRLIKTTNGGGSWEELTIPTSSFLSDVLFIDASRGWIASAGGTALRTDDGGKTWRQEDLGGNCNRVNAFATSGDSVWAAASCGVVYKSDDRGETWIRHATGASAAEFKTISAVSPERAWVGGKKHGPNTPLILETTDGGATWLSSFEAGGRQGFVYDISTRLSESGVSGWAVGDSGLLLSLVPSELVAELEVPLQLAASAEGLPESSSIPGFTFDTTWDEITPFTFDSLYGVEVGDSGILVSGDGGTVYQSADGATWRPSKTPGNCVIGDAITHPLGILAIHQCNGDLYRLPTGSNTWITLGSGLTAPFAGISMWFLDESTGWVAGNRGQLARTLDGGQTWVRSTVPTAKAIQALKFATPEVGWLVGTDGGLLQTNDGGDSWELSPLSVPCIELHDLHVDGKEIWVVGGCGDVFFSADGGVTWDNRSVGTDINFWTIDVWDDQTAWAGGTRVGSSRAVILETRDGGISWSTVFTSDSNSTVIQDISVNNDPENPVAWAVGDGGLVVKMTATSP